MKIGIIGTRGIPNTYGGFEEFAQQVGVRLAKKGHAVTVYNSHNHPYQDKEFDGANIIHKYDPEKRLGTFGQFIYDFNSIVDARWRKYDILLQLGYTSSSVWSWLMPNQSVVITNMDGLEWKRSKYSSRVQSFLRKAEKWAVQGSSLLIADSKGILNYLENKYRAQVVYLTYGAEIFKNPDETLLEQYSVEPFEYNIVVARLEPENHLETILSGVLRSESQKVTLVVGNHETEYGSYLKDTFRDSRIRFIKATYKKEKILNLRHYAHIYFHGHSVGGTNPSLLEAMGCQNMICAHDNEFNREVLGEDGNFFKDDVDIANTLDHLERNDIQKTKIKQNLEKLENHYNWDLIAEQYEVVFQQALIR